MNPREYTGRLLISPVKSGGTIAQWQLSFPSVLGPGFKHPMLNVNTSSWGSALKHTLPCALTVREGSENIMFLTAPQTTDSWSYKTLCQMLDSTVLVIATVYIPSICNHTSASKNPGYFRPKLTYLVSLMLTCGVFLHRCKAIICFSTRLALLALLPVKEIMNSEPPILDWASRSALFTPFLKQKVV